MAVTASAEDRLRLLESCVRGIVFEFDERGRYLEVWTHDEALLAAPRSALLGKTIDEVLGKEAGAVFNELITKALATREPQRHEYPLTVLGGPRWFVGEVFPGRADRTAVLLVQDITERKQLEARMLESERLAQIGLLAGGVGHEINNPLAWVMMHLTRLHAEVTSRAADGAAPNLPRWSEALAEALEGTERIRQIVRDLSFFTRSPELESSVIDLRRALDWAADMAMAQLRHKARLTKRYTAAPRVFASEARLGQVFLNLLINAAHAIDEGKVEANEVMVELSTDSEGRARVDVTDTGGGIATELAPRLFEPFVTTKPREQGSGLGLSISRRIVESFAGTLELVTSQAGATRFRVTLPATTGEIAVPGRVERTASGIARLKVLLIDDQPRFLTTLQLALSDRVKAEIETSARAALARLQRGERFDAIVCDVMMPDVTGVELYEAVARDFPDQRHRIVFMTGGAYSPRARAFLESVPNRRIDKPFRPEQLEALLAEVCAAEEEREPGSTH